jgi:acetyl esterase/lipase
MSGVIVEPASVAYGSHPAQFGELYRPTAPEHAGVVVILHGGFWRARYDLSLGRALAIDLAAHGYVAWNVEYRRVGNGGGWPTTVQDVAAAIDRLAELDVDASRVVAVGHSAGGQLAAWASGRLRARVPLAAAVSQAGVLDLSAAWRAQLGNGAVADFLGGTPDDVPDRYRAADPLTAAPLPVPVLCVHARADETVPITQSERYVAAAGRAAALREVPGDHFTVIEARDVSWSIVRAALPDLLAGRLPPAT